MRAPFVTGIPILRQPPAASEPGEGALDDPAPRQDDEAFRLIGSFDDLDIDADDHLVDRLAEFRPLITAVSIELQQKRKRSEQRRHHQRAAVAVLDVGGVHERMHQQALRIDEDVALLALDLLAGVVARRIDAAPSFQPLSRSGCQ